MTEDNFREHTIRQALSTKTFGHSLVFLDSTVSTMIEARKLVNNSAPEGTLVIAEEQTGGKGRFDRDWVSPHGVNLYISLILRPSTEVLVKLGIITSLALARIIDNFLPSYKNVSIKWPNDLRINKKKVAGILIENHIGDHQNHNYSIIGVGINVNSQPIKTPSISAIATSVFQETNNVTNRVEFLKSFLKELENLYLNVLNYDSINHEWKMYLDNIGDNITVRWGDYTYVGIAEDVDTNGSLILRLQDGNIRTLPAGEVTLTV